MTSPVRPTDDDARQLARGLMQEARFAALGVLTEQGAPLVTRVAFGLDPDGLPISLVSTLAAHTHALQTRPEASLLVGEPGKKGDPLTHPRLTINALAELLPNACDAHEALAAHYLRDHPKAKFYVGFGDFHFVRFSVQGAFLNGGFGKAFELSPTDLLR